jgi:glycosyltransferase involved in cell wall biosynthesis
MRILFLARRFYPQVGGVETHLMKISEGLVRKGHKITIVCEALDEKANPKQKSPNVIKNNITVYRLPKIKTGKLKKFYIWYWFLKNKRLVQNADIIHAHDVFYWYLPFRFLYPKKPVYTTFHGYEQYPVLYKNIIIRKVSEKLSKGNICIGNFICKWYKTNPTFISYGAVEKINPVSVKDSYSAVFIGRLVEQTGITTYADAFNLILKQKPDFKFTVAGDGKYKNKLNSKIKFLGNQSHQQIIKLLQANRFAFVSGYLSILEAMAEKRLVIAVYDNPLKKDYLTMTPFAQWINIINSSEGVSKIVDQYIKHSEKEKEMIDKAYQWVQGQTWGNMVDLYLRLWEMSFSS